MYTNGRQWAQPLWEKAAIPHGFTEHVTKPAIAILTLQDAILWEDDFETNII